VQHHVLSHFAHEQNMTTDIHQHLSIVATAIADPSRAKILCGLMDGKAYTATELSTIAEIAPSTTSAHLNKLQDQGLIKLIQQGRHRYFCLANDDVAQLLETLMSFSVPQNDAIKSSTPLPLRLSRSCYQHLAGTIAVQIRQAMLQKKWLMGEQRYYLTDLGKNELKNIGLDIGNINLHSTKLAYDCLDWSERKPHLSGQLAQQLFKLFEQKNWVQRYPQTREAIWTEQGKIALKRYFGIDYPT